MGESEVNNNERKSSEIVRLKLDGANTSLNTLRDQQTERGISLVCPFPSLEVDLPVSFGADKNGTMKRGSIHRIGVEDDPETGLPRLRLSIRKIDDEPLEAESKRQEKEVDAPKKQMSDTFDDNILETRAPSLYQDDPAWVSCFEVPMPESFLERSKTRRRHKMIARAAMIVTLAALAGAGYALERSGYLTVEKARSYISGFSVNSFLGAPYDAKQTSVASVEQAEVRPETVVAEAKTAPLLSPEPPDAPEAVFDEETQSEPEIQAEAETQPAQTPANPDTENKADPNLESPANSEPGATGEIQLLLPTRWPVEYASGYRIRDPNGVVIDVPGGLVKREGWLDDIAKHPAIRSIKSIQRETGARFIVRINGELPRFITAPKTGGVFLTLYYGEEPEAAPSEKVALAQ